MITGMGSTKKEARNDCAKNALYTCIANHINPVWEKLARRATGIKLPNPVPAIPDDQLIALIKNNNTSSDEPVSFLYNVGIVPFIFVLILANLGRMWS